VKNKDKLKRLPNRTDSMCFGCSPMNPAGLRLEFYTDGDAIFSWLKVPDHLCGWKNLAHGGVISAILDEVMGRTVIHKMRCLGMTKAITIEFLKPVTINTELMATGRVIDVRNDRECLTEGMLFNGAGELCAKARGTFVLFQPDRSKKMGIKDDDAMEWFNAFMKEQ